MKTLPPYATQYGKILDAYMKDEIKPYHMKFCFCGTLAAKEVTSFYGVEVFWSNELYTDVELSKMEYALLNAIRWGTYPHSELTVQATFNTSPTAPHWDKVKHPNYENALFNGMSAALDVLKAIHEAHGEVIDQPSTLPQRSLHPVN